MSISSFARSVLRPLLRSAAVSRSIGTISTLESEEQFDEAFQGSTPTVIDFYADWCGPCKQLSPILKQAIEDHPQQVNLLMVNVDDFGDIAHEFDVMSIPAVKLVKEGSVQGGFVGSKPADKVAAFLDEQLK